MILLIDNYDSFVYNLYQQIAQTEKKLRVFRNDKITLADIEQMQPKGIILSPGPGRPEEAGICVELIRAFSGRIPILGVCLGHQAIAVAFGGQVISAEQIIHGKPETIFHYRQHLYRNMPLPFTAGRYHSLMVDKTTLPVVLIIESETKQGLLMGMRHQSHPTFGVQYHPESILTPEGPLLLKAFIELCQSPRE
jgi:anthranilate synthase/aminodeoxychorismate synthase-like glutamine amidotransferase